MPAILRRQHQPTNTRPRKSTCKQQQIIGVQALVCQGITKKAKIKLDIIDKHNDPLNLRLPEALKIRKFKLEINSREECAELKDLLF